MQMIVPSNAVTVLAWGFEHFGTLTGSLWVTLIISFPSGFFGTEKVRTLNRRIVERVWSSFQIVCSSSLEVAPLLLYLCMNVLCLTCPCYIYVPLVGCSILCHYILSSYPLFLDAHDPPFQLPRPLSYKSSLPSVASLLHSLEDKMVFVIDLEGYFRTNDPVINEFCMVSVNGNTFAHCLLKSPKTCASVIAELSHRGLQWSDGYVDYQYGICLLKDIVALADVVYIKGAECCRIISNLTKKEPINLENLDIPLTFEHKESAIACFFPPHNMGNYICAVVKAQQYKRWLLGRKEEDSDSSSSFNCDCGLDCGLFTSKCKTSDACTNYCNCIPTLLSITHL